MARGDIYPSWRYHKTEKPVLCKNAEQDASLGDEWSDNDIRVFGEAPAPAETVDPPTDPPADPPAAAPKKRGRKPKA